MSNDLSPIVNPPTDSHDDIADDPIMVDDEAVIIEDETLEEDNKTKKDGFKGIVSTIAILVIAPLIALSLTAFVFQSYEVDGPSMESTLQNKDRLIVYKLPRTIAKITKKPYLPERGDIIIFTRKDNYSFGGSESRQLIKRVIALPGEKIAIANNKITVYNKEKPEGFNPDDAEYGKTLGSATRDMAEQTVPENTVFVCGDNRENSLDSRSFGAVPLDDVIGKLSIRVYPFNKGQVF